MYDFTIHSRSLMHTANLEILQIERCSPRFRPGDRFCEPSFRYLLPGSEEEKCRPLNHMSQIPFIHSVRLINHSNIYSYDSAVIIFSMLCVQVCLERHKIDNCACALKRKQVYHRTRIIVSRGRLPPLTMQEFALLCHADELTSPE